MSGLFMSQQAATSAEGYEYIKPKLNEMQAAILSMLRRLGATGATDSEIAYELGIGDNARKRRNELCKQGLVMPAGKRPRCDGYGRAVGPVKQTVWVAVEHAAPSNVVSNARCADLAGAVSTAARRLKRAINSSEATADNLYSKHMALVDCMQAMTAEFWRYYERMVPMRTCLDCHGDGHVMLDVDCADGHGEHMTRKQLFECQECNGLGEVEHTPWEDQ